MWTQLKKKENLERVHTGCTLGIIELCIEMGVPVGVLAVIVTILILARELGSILWVAEKAEEEIVKEVKR